MYLKVVQLQVQVHLYSIIIAYYFKGLIYKFLCENKTRNEKFVCYYRYRQHFYTALMPVAVSFALIA